MSRAKQKKKIFLFLLTIFIFILTISAIKVYLIIEDSKSTKNNLMYTNNTSIDYSVSINENEFIKNEDLESYEMFISETVRSIKMKMSYKYNASEDISVNETHKIFATIYGRYNETPTDPDNNPIIWQRKYVIKDRAAKEYPKTSLVDIEEEFDLDWNYYNQEVIKFKENFSLPTTAFLEVKMVVDIFGQSNNYTLNETKEVIANIPLAEQVFSVEKIEEKDENKMVSSKDIISHQKEQRKLAAYIILVVISFVLVVITIKQILNCKEKQPFQEEIDQIKHDYDEIVVETKNMVDTTDLNPVTITTFDEMLNLADSLMMPIMLYEERNLACFYIIKSEMIYVYLRRNKHKKRQHKPKEQV